MNEELAKRLLELQGEDIVIGGAWILVFATLISALGETRLLLVEESESNVGTGDREEEEANETEINEGEDEERENRAREIVVAGQGLESFGNVIQAIGRTKIYEASPSEPRKLGVIGCWFQAAGNAGNAVATQMEVVGLEEAGFRNNAVSSGVQSFGAALEAAGAAGEEFTPFQGLEVSGNFVIAYGSALDSVGNLFLLQNRETEGELIIVASSWIQFIGAIMELVAVTGIGELLRSEIADTIKGSGNQSSNRYSSYSRYNGRR